MRQAWRGTTWLLLSVLVIGLIACSPDPKAPAYSSLTRQSTPADVPPPGRDLYAEAAHIDTESWLWIGSSGSTDIYAVRTDDRQLCLVVYSEGGSGLACGADSTKGASDPIPFSFFYGPDYNLLIGILPDDARGVTAPIHCAVRENIVIIENPVRDDLEIVVTYSSGERVSFDLSKEESDIPSTGPMGCS